jgi:hypothetical protein
MSKLTFGQMSAPTPLWAKKVRNTALKVGAGLVLIGGAIVALPVSLPASVVTIATNAVIYGGSLTTLVSAISQAFGVEEKTNEETNQEII